MFPRALDLTVITKTSGRSARDTNKMSDIWPPEVAQAMRVMCCVVDRNDVLVFGAFLFCNNGVINKGLLPRPNFLNGWSRFTSMPVAKFVQVPNIGLALL